MNKNSLYICIAILFLSLSARFVFSDDATSTTCGTVQGSLTIAANILVNDNCFTINKSNITLNGAGYTVTGNGSGIGVNVTGFYNVTIKDFAGLNNFTTGTFVKDAENGTLLNNTIIQSNISTTILVHFRDSLRWNITKNTLVVNGTIDSRGIFLWYSDRTTIDENNIRSVGPSGQDVIQTSSSNTLTISGNNLTLTSDGANTAINTVTVAENSTISHNVMNKAVTLTGFKGGTFTNNTISYTSNPGRPLLQISWSNYSTFSSNRITTNFTGFSGLELSKGNYWNNFTSNEIHLIGTDPDTYALFINASSADNIFRNNNLSTSSSAPEIQDTTRDGTLNYLIYNNSHGEIRWTATATGGFLDNLTINGSIGLDKNLIIGQNIAGVNTTAISGGQISSAANITLYGLAVDSLDSIYKSSTYYLIASDVITNGANCMGGTCTLISYSGGTAKFTTTSFSSFATDGTTNAVPEFADYALLLALSLSLGGVMILQKKRK